MVWVGWGLLGGCHACMRYLQNARGGGGEGEGEEEELWQAREEEEGSYSYAGGESGYSSTRTESSSPHSSTREEGGPASLPSQVKMLENTKTHLPSKCLKTQNTSQVKMVENLNATQNPPLHSLH